MHETGLFLFICLVYVSCVSQKQILAIFRKYLDTFLFNRNHMFYIIFFPHKWKNYLTLMTPLIDLFTVASR
jgi:hypothetical protein